MNTPLDLKALERKAWTAYFQDGLWDIYLGLLLFVQAFTIPVLEGMKDRWPGYILYCALLGSAWLLFWAGRHFITIPRLGLARFGAWRRQKKARLTLVMGGCVLLTVLLLFFTAAANNNPDTWGRLMPQGLAMPLLIGAFVGLVITFIAYFNDFMRGYYIALVFALSFTGNEVLDNPVVFWIGGVLILIPGLVLLVRFLRQHPQPPSEVPHDQPGA